MPVDSFKWLPPPVANQYRAQKLERVEVPWTPLAKPIAESRFALVSTGGLYVKGKDPPFDMERERREPNWGDPTYRVIPRDVRQEEIDATHLHVNTAGMVEDINVALPIHRFLELEERGEIGSLAASHYSFMGFQGFPEDIAPWRDQYVPEVVRRMKEEEVDAALLAPA